MKIWNVLNGVSNIIKHLKKKTEIEFLFKRLEDKYDYSNVNCPATFEDITTFENNNNISVFVYGIDEENNIRTEKTGNIDYKQNDIIYLLRVESDET